MDKGLTATTMKRRRINLPTIQRDSVYGKPLCLVVPLAHHDIMAIEIKEGSVVKCIQPTLFMKSRGGSRFEKGNYYLVEHIDNGGVYLTPMSPQDVQPTDLEKTKFGYYFTMSKSASSDRFVVIAE